MKTTTNQNPDHFIETLLALLILTLTAAATLCFSGCQNTSPQAVAYRTEGTLTTTVNTAMQAWADYVHTYPQPQSQIDQVKGAYQKYFDAQMAAKGAVEAYIANSTPGNSNAVAQTTAAVSESAAAILDLVRQLTNNQGMKNGSSHN